MRHGAAWVLAVLAGLAAAPAHAAWPQPRGEALIITSLSSYRTNNRFDEFGLRAPGHGYHKQELSVYGVYGLTGYLTLGAQPVYAKIDAKRTAGTASERTSGLTSIELFARQRIVTGGNWILSAQALVKLPGTLDAGREPLVETSNKDAEGRLLYGSSGRLFGREYFSVAEAAFRARSNGTSDQIRADATFGIRPWPKWQLIAQNFSTIAITQRQSAGPENFDLYKAQLAILYDLPRGRSIQLGGFSEYAGRNTGAGYGLFVALWSRF